MQPRRPSYQYQDSLNQGIFKHKLVLILLTLLIFTIVVCVLIPDKDTALSVQEIQSGIKGYCLDDHINSTIKNAKVDSWKCNNSNAQKWSETSINIKHGSSVCLAVENNGKSSGDLVVQNSCDNSPGQVWIQDRSALYNPNSRMCLTIPSGKVKHQLVISSCGDLTNVNEIWIPLSSSTTNIYNCNSGSEGQRVACEAIKQWTIWQSGTIDHATLLSKYTANATYEEWCADFVSYVYMKAGYPFTGGEYDGWDENDAANIQNMGFTMEDSPSYIPQAGDVGFFSYNGGHVEIVISGGKTPTFIYGNSGTIDPTTGNGEMASNTITNDGSEGQLLYYLSPTN